MTLSSASSPATSAAPTDGQVKPSASSTDDHLPVPDYISPVHWPSTNPVFQLSKYEFAPSTDLSTSKMRVEVWGRTGGGESQSPDNRRSPAGKAADTKGKGKAKQPDEATSSEWRVLETWDVDLRHLTALTEDVSLPHILSHAG